MTNVFGRDVWAGPLLPLAEAGEAQWPVDEDQPPERALETLDWISLIMLGLAGATVVFFHFMGMTEDALLPAGILGGLAILISPFIGLCISFMLLPLEGLTTILSGAATLSKIVAILVAAAFVLRLVLDKLVLNRDWSVGQLFRSRALRWMCVPVAWGILILPLGDGLGWPGLISLGIQAEMIGLALLYAAVPRNFAQVRFLCLVGALGGGLLSVWGEIVGGEELYREGERLSAGTNANGLAAALSLCLFAAALVWQRCGKTLRILVVLLGLFIAAAIVLTNSRGTWLGLALTVILVPFLAPRVSMKTKGIILAVVVGIGAIGFCMVTFNVLGDTGQAVMERIRTFTGEGKHGEVNSRLDWIWPHYLAVVAHNPLIGGGPGKIFVDDLSPHCDYIWLMAEGGVPGLLLFLAFIVVTFREIWRNQDEWLRMCSVMIAIFTFTAGLTHVTYMGKPYGTAIGLLACMANLGFCPRPEELELAALDVQAEAGPRGQGPLPQLPAGGPVET